MLTSFQEGQLAGVALVGIGFIIYKVASALFPSKPVEDIQNFEKGIWVFYSNWENVVSEVKIIQYLGNNKYIIVDNRNVLREVWENTLTKITKLDVKA